MSNYEERNPPDITCDEVFTAIKDAFPQYSLGDLVFYYHGTYNVFNLGGEYMVRVPDRSFRNGAGVELIRHEVALLARLHGRFSNPIPFPQMYSDIPSLPWVAYRRIPGLSLSRCIDGIPYHQQALLGAEIGAFLSCLHSPSIDALCRPVIASDRIMDPQQARSSWEALLVRTRHDIYPHISSHAQDWLERVFCPFLDAPNNFSYTPVVSHGDFDTSNILVDPSLHKLAGIIDFEELGISDPAVDLLFFDEQPVFFNSVISTYVERRQKDGIGEDDMSSLRARMQFLYCRTCLPYFEFGLANNRPAMVDAARIILKKNMKKFPLE